MSYAAMALSILLSVINACLLRKYNDAGKKGLNVYLFNAGISGVWIVILLVLLIVSDNTWNPLAVFYGVLYGIVLFAFLLFKTLSMANGPISLSTLIGSCAFLIATAFGVLYCKESVRPVQIIGMILLMLSLVLCVNPKKSKEKLSPKWMLYCLGFFLAGGFVGIIYKLFGRSSAGNEKEVMMLTAAVTAMLLFLIFGMLLSQKSGGRVLPDRKSLLFILLSGMASCGYIRMNLSLSNLIPSVVFFPVSNGGMVILSTIAARLIYQEKLTARQLLGIACGCIAVILVGCGDYLLGFLF